MSSSGSTSSGCSRDCATSTSSDSGSGSATTGATTSTISSSTTTSTTGPGTSIGDDPVCGNGIPENGEECDDGPDNADDAACTAHCTIATCGDELIQKDVEVCDDGVNDGMYGGCASDCKALAPYCGDNTPDIGNEECDGDAACLAGMCKYAKSCLDYKLADPMSASGKYLIRRDGIAEVIQVWCEMADAVDGGGYTFLKVDVDSDTNDYPAFAKKAEIECGKFGMQLLVPRSNAHLSAAYAVATTENVAPMGGGKVSSNTDYLQILGIYPVSANVSCPNKELNSVDCPEWAASDQQVYWVSASAIGTDEPDPAGACLGCSMIYTWNMNGSVQKYKAIPNGGSSFRFMCDTGDKLP